MEKAEGFLGFLNAFLQNFFVKIVKNFSKGSRQKRKHVLKCLCYMEKRENGESVHQLRNLFAEPQNRSDIRGLCYGKNRHH